MDTLLGQKRLERIILINSSTFRYAEVMVDGNTHISGDNSSGKTTFLQIETIFYTGDTSSKALGIGDGKLPFAQYNLKMNNSYIVYEVRRSGEPGDCFLVFLKNSNWPTFQFFDCPYSKDIFIDGNGVAYDNLENVRNAAERLHPGLDMQQAKGKKEYIDILYGWRDGIVGKKRSLEKFSLTSCRGLDRPHEKITNLLKMLLGLGKVQGDVLKEMIVGSMGSTAKPFDVPVERERASQLVRECNCIRSWLSDPNILARQKQYQKTYELFVKEKADYLLYPGKAKYARQEAESMIEIISKELEEAQGEYDSFTKKVTERREEAKDIIDSLKVRQVRLQGDYDKIAEKKALYAPLLPLLPLMESEGQKKGSLEIATRRLDDLSGQLSTLKEKFESQKSELQGKFSTRKAEVEKVIAQKETDAATRKGEISDTIEDERSAEERRHNDKISHLGSRKDALTKRKHDGELELQKIMGSRPKRDELERLKERERSLTQEIRQLDKEIASLDYELDSAEKDKKSASKDIQLEHSAALFEKETAIKEARRKVDEIAAKLSTFDGSLAEWLSRNMEGWNQNLGKILSESVLFNPNLSPEKVPAASDSAYGVKLDLSGLSPTETDPALLQERLENARLAQEKAEKALEEEKRLVEEAVARRLDEIEKRIAETKKRHEELGKKKLSQSEVLDVVKSQITSVSDEQERLIAQEASKKTGEIEESKQQLSAVLREISDENKAYKGFCDALGQRKRDLQEEIDDSFKKEKTSLLKALQEEEKNLEKELTQIDADLAQALSENGVDADRIKALQDEITALNKELKTIEDNRLSYHGYLKDKADYLDHENEWAASLASLTESISKNERDESEKVTEEDRIILEKEALIQERKGEIELSQKEVTLVKDYYATHRQEEYASAEPVETDYAAEEIIKADEGAETKIENLKNVLNLCWSAFRNNLGEFGIRRFFPGSAACPDLGEDPRAQQDVYEFITENLIAEHCKGWNAAAVPFVSGISYQATEFATDIKKVRETVVGINRLFREYNFTDVIHRLELSVEDVGSDLIALIKRSIEIHDDYCGDENSDRNFLDGSSFNKKFISFIEEIAGKLATDDHEQLDIEDMFTLYIEVDEGLNRSGRRRDIKDLGSNGIDTIFKNLLYLLLLTNIRKRCSNDGQGFMIHCPIDEQATLSPSNFNNLMELANRMGVFILANSPVLPNGTEESFRNAYTFWKRKGSEFTNSVPILKFNTIEEDDDEREAES